MRKIYYALRISSIVFFVLSTAMDSYGQCTGGLSAVTNLNPITTTYQTISFQHGYYKTFGATAGKVYHFTFCSNGGSTSFDTQITILNSSGVAQAGGYNDDGCPVGLGSDLTWTAPSSATYRVLVNTFDCSPSTTNTSTMAYGLPLSANDVCSGAISVAIPSTTAGNTGNSTADTAPTCTVPDQSSGGVWYSLVGNGGKLKASLCAVTNYDSQIRVFTGSCTGLTCVTGDDDACSLSGPSEVTWNSVSGTTYRILVNGFSGATGAYSLSISVLPPDNDLCSAATSVSIPSTTAGNTGNATADTAPTCTVTDQPSGGVWYSLVGNGGKLKASLCAVTIYDSQIRVFTGSCTALTCVTGDDDACSFSGPSEVTWNSVSGTTYRILVNGFSGATGGYSLSISALPPDNDLCTAATSVSIGSSTTGITTFATADVATTCTVTDNTSGGVWFKLTGNGQNITASLCTSTNFNTKMRVFSGTTCSALTCVAGNDDGCPTGTGSVVSWCSVSGTTYFMLVYGFTGATTGTFSLGITGVDIPAKPTITLSGNNTANPVLTSSIASGNQWYLNDVIISGAIASSYIVSQQGIYKVRASVGSCPGPFSDPFAIIITGDIYSSTSAGFSLYPNPASNEITVLWDTGNPEGKNIYVYDLLGRRISESSMNENKLRIDISALPTGQYILKGIQGSTTVHGHFNKNKN